MTTKKAEASQAPPYRKRKNSPTPKTIDLDDVNDASGSGTQSKDDPVPQSPARSSPNSDEETFESTLTFNVIQSAYVDKKRIYTEPREHSVADKWITVFFDLDAEDKVQKDAELNGYEYRRRSRTAVLVVHGKRTFENTIDDDEDVIRMNQKIDNLFPAGKKDIRIEYVIKYVNTTAAEAARKRLEREKNPAPAKKQKVRNAAPPLAAPQPPATQTYGPWGAWAVPPPLLPWTMSQQNQPEVFRSFPAASEESDPDKEVDEYIDHLMRLHPTKREKIERVARNIKDQDMTLKHVHEMKEDGLRKEPLGATIGIAKIIYQGIKPWQRSKSSS
jgi:hypothetical protein